MEHRHPPIQPPTLEGLRKRAQNLSQSWASNPPEAHAALLNAWILVLERIRIEGKDMDLSAINTLSGILQRLIGSQKQLNDLAQRTPDTQPKTLDTQTLQELEQMLKLL